MTLSTAQKQNTLLMIKNLACTIVFILFVCSFSFGQNIYPKKFEGCNTQRFALENDSTTAKVKKELLADLISKNIDEKTLGKIRGILKLQIIAYQDNSSCLLSYENATNLSDKKINIKSLKKIIDNELVWDSVKETVSPMIEFYFLAGKIKVVRMGFGGEKGIHELAD